VRLWLGYVRPCALWWTQSTLV